MKKIILAEVFIGVELQPRYVRAPIPRMMDLQHVNSSCSGSFTSFKLHEKSKYRYRKDRFLSYTHLVEKYMKIGNTIPNRMIITIHTHRWKGARYVWKLMDGDGVLITRTIL